MLAKLVQLADSLTLETTGDLLLLTVPQLQAFAYTHAPAEVAAQKNSLKSKAAWQELVRSATQLAEGPATKVARTEPRVASSRDSDAADPAVSGADSSEGQSGSQKVHHFREGFRPLISHSK